MVVLVAYGSSGGSTAEIGDWIADELRATGVDVHCRAAAEVDDVSGYRAVVLGGSLYAAGWHLDARRFAQRFADQLATRPVWLFSSGPLDTSADETTLEPAPQVAAVLRMVSARGHETFGGRLSDEAHGWLGVLGRQMSLNGHGVDFRNPTRVRAWARKIGAELDRPSS